MAKSDTLDMTANPAPLGLLGFGMTTVLLNFHNAGLFPLDSMVLAMGIFYGGLAQIFAGLLEWKKGNTFGTTAFTSFGVFWLTLVALILLPKMNLGVAAPDNRSMALFLDVWGAFTLAMFFPTLRISKALQVIFASLAVLFFLLAAAHSSGSESLTRIAGWEGIFCGASAVYAALAQVVNETYGKAILPLGIVKR